MDVHRPVLTVLEGSKSVEYERLSGGPGGTHSFMKEKAVPAEAIGEASDGGVGDARLSGDLPQGGAGHESVEDGLEEIASAEPVVGGEGL
jgi:hypothetical protein